MEPQLGPNLLTWALAACSALFASLSGLLTWSARRQVGRSDDHSQRLRTLENDRVTKGDITAVYERIDSLARQSGAQFVDLRNRLDDQNTRMGAQHAQILNTIIAQRKS
jgi:hypothetical protein